ncbi:MAG TPA: nitrous oxide reductase family maturation protein NosD [Acidimicrobiia bacterium]|nr:nitrous oxide reductase family maturation protein NosD [Acidimicrobiia bacterium]
MTIPWLLALITVLGAFAASPSAASTDLQALIDATPPGGTLTLAPGAYDAPVTITSPITINGSRDAIVDAHGVGSVITIEAPDVTIDGITIRGSGSSLDRENSGITSIDAPRVTITNTILDDVLFGIFLRTAPDSVVQGNTIGAKEIDIARRGDGIRLWESHRSVVDSNDITGGRDLVFWFTDGIVVKGNTVRDGRYGLHLMYSDHALIEGNDLSHNSVGAFLMYSRGMAVRNNVFSSNSGPSGYGVGLKEIDDVVIEHNRLVANRVGIYLDNSPTSVESTGLIADNLIAYNRVGVLFLPNVKRNTVVGNTFIDNAEQVGVTGSGSFSGNEWNARGAGNYWSDYAGYDADGDGVGEVVYRVNDLYDTITDQYPQLAFFDETPAAKAIDIAARMFPVFRPDPLVEDTHPLISRPALAPVGRTLEESSNFAMGLTAIAMIASGLTIVGVPVLRSRRSRPEVIS